jgi:hypothetical protein
MVASVFVGVGVVDSGHENVQLLYPEDNTKNNKTTYISQAIHITKSSMHSGCLEDSSR